MENEREPDTLTENPVPVRPFRAGDTVLHEPTGETWLLILDEHEGHVVPGGWPVTRAKTTDCRLVEAASDEQRIATLQAVATGGRPEQTLAMQQAHNQFTNSDSPAAAPSEPTNWVERCERLQAELGAAKQREQNHLRLIERLVELGDLSSVDWSAEQEEELAPILIAARIHLKENGRG